MSLFFVAVGSATAEFFAGEPELLAIPSRNPAPDDRLIVISSPHCCSGEPGWETWNDGVLRLLSTLLGPSSRTYTGPYPSRDEALALMQKHGSTATVVAPGRVRLPSGEEYEVVPITDENRLFLASNPDFALKEQLDPWQLTQLDFERRLAGRLVPLSQVAALVETKDEVQLRIWSNGHLGKEWATWRQDDEHK